MMLEETTGSPHPLMAGLAGRCPHCGKGHLFEGFMEVKPACEVCGLSYSFAQSSDGPAVFVMLIAGFLVLGSALWFDMVYEPPIWVHLVVSLPLAMAVCLGMLRSFKGLFIALEYTHRAAAK